MELIMIKMLIDSYFAQSLTKESRLDIQTYFPPRQNHFDEFWWINRLIWSLINYYLCILEQGHVCFIKEIIPRPHIISIHWSIYPRPNLDNYSKPLQRAGYTYKKIHIINSIDSNTLGNTWPRVGDSTWIHSSTE